MRKNLCAADQEERVVLELALISGGKAKAEKRPLAQLAQVSVRRVAEYDVEAPSPSRSAHFSGMSR